MARVKEARRAGGTFLGARVRSRRATAAAVCLLLLATEGTQAQVLPRGSRDRPVERQREQQRRELQEFNRRQPEESVLPPAPLPAPGTPERHAGEAQFLARGFLFSGNTVFSQQELEETAKPYVNQWLTRADLQRLRDELTLRYVKAGFVNSGAILPDQDVRDGIVEYRIVEGRLGEIEIEGNRYYRAGRLRARLDPGGDHPLQISELEDRLQLLLLDDRIRRLDAKLVPGVRAGDAKLQVGIEEHLPWQLSFEYDNETSPSVGSMGGTVSLANRNLTGNGDTLRGSYQFTRGLTDAEGSYELPLTASDTRLELHYEYNLGKVVEDPFQPLDIKSRLISYGIGMSHPVYRTRTQELRIGFTSDRREDVTYLLGRRFSFSPGAQDGVSRLTVLRFYQDWVKRGATQVLAARSTVSVGLDVLGATGASEARFVDWLAQFQWARRFDRWWGIETIFRTDVQISSSPLFPMEQFSLGGAMSVRGYRENEIVRDNGWMSALEVRIPVWHASDGRPIVQIAPFVNGGTAWNTQRPTGEPKGLASIGVGIRVSPISRIHGELYWGHRLISVVEPQHKSLQDQGIEFIVSLDLL